MGSMSLRGLWTVGAALELVWVLCLMHGAFAQSNNCSVNTFTPLVPCLTYITAGNTSTTPSSDCCAALHSFLTSSDSACICQIPSIAQQAGLSFNETRGLEVVKACYNNQAVPAIVTSCFSVAPVEAPSEAPGSSLSPPQASTSAGTPPPQAGGNHSSALLPPSFLLISSILVALSLHLGTMST